MYLFYEINMAYSPDYYNLQYVSWLPSLKKCMKIFTKYTQIVNNLKFNLI